MRGIWTGGMTRKQMNHWQSSGGKYTPLPPDYIDVSNFDGYLWGLTNGEDTYYLRGGYGAYGDELDKTKIYYRDAYNIIYGSWKKSYGYKKDNGDYFGIYVSMSDEIKMSILEAGGTSTIPDKEIIPWVKYWCIQYGGFSVTTVPDVLFENEEEMKKGIIKATTCNKIEVPYGYNKIVEGTYTDGPHTIDSDTFMADGLERIGNSLSYNYYSLSLASYRKNMEQMPVLNKRLFLPFRDNSNTLMDTANHGGLRLALGISDLNYEYLGIGRNIWRSGYMITKFTKKE